MDIRWLRWLLYDGYIVKQTLLHLLIDLKYEATSCYTSTEAITDTNIGALLRLPATALEAYRWRIPDDAVDRYHQYHQSTTHPMDDR